MDRSGNLSFQGRNPYEKLFFGNNLPAMTPLGEHYTPARTDEELDDIRRHVVLGFDLSEKTIYALNLTSN